MPTVASSRSQRGLSLVELMVGIAVGMFVVAGAVLVASTQLGENRRLLLETQLHQDLRASADIVTRELRRAGSSTLAAAGGVWNGVAGTTPAQNLYAAVTPASGESSQVDFGYWLTGGMTNFGFKLEDERLKLYRGNPGSPWHELTDINVMRVTNFTVDAQDEGTILIPCPRICTGGADPTACWPTLKVRSYVVTIEAEAANDPLVKRSITSHVRLPNDALVFNNGLNACPT